MKIFSAGLLLVVSLFCSCAVKPVTSMKTSETSINTTSKAMNAGDKSRNSLKIGKVEVSGAGNINVEIENSSREPLKVWEDSNSWGAACWRVLLIRKGQVETFFQNPDQMFTVNRPAVNEIAGGGHIEQKLDLNGGNWCGLGHCAPHHERGFGDSRISFESNDMLIVIYDVPVTQEARDLGVWYGVVAASTTVQ